MNVLELGHLLDPIEEKIEEGKDTMSNRIRAALKAFTRWAFERDFVDIDIGSRLPKALSEKPRERTPSIEEVRTIWAASSGMGELWGPFIRLLILTGQRRGEICNLRWSEVDLINGVISKKSAETKNGQPHKTHLSSIALYELQKLAARKNGVFVFTTTGATPVSGISRMKKRLDALLGDNFEAWTFHDLRRAMASALCERGYSEAVVDRILNHQAVGSAPSAVSLVYNTAQHLPERAAALDAWSEIVTSELGSIAELNTYR
jgi:integrase